jgi:hypothetical protein
MGWTPSCVLPGLAAANTLAMLALLLGPYSSPAVQMIRMLPARRRKTVPKSDQVLRPPVQGTCKDNVPKPVFQTNAPIINNIIARFGGTEII